VAVKAWEALSKITGRDHTHLASAASTTRSASATCRRSRARSSRRRPGLVWNREVSYNAGYTNVHELIPWRTLTGRQQFYQDHRWMLDFGEGSVCTSRRSTPRRLRRCSAKAERQPRDRAELHHPAPEVGHPLTYSDNLRC
jgi:nitrate reductase alpha subunit